MLTINFDKIIIISFSETLDLILMLKYLSSLDDLRAKVGMLCFLSPEIA